MTKEKWIAHIEETTGLSRPSQGLTSREEWDRACKQHLADYPKCPVCQARRKTARAQNQRRAREEVYRNLGLEKVRSISGKTYWE